MLAGEVSSYAASLSTMANDEISYSLSHHAELRLAERKIEWAWVALTIAEPTLVESHPEDPTCQCVYRAIPEAGGRVQTMNIEYDSDVDALYLRLAEGEIVESDSIEPNVVYDYAADDRVIGVELLRVSANLPGLAVRAFPFRSLEQQVEFMRFLEAIADTDLQAKLAFARQILQNQQALLQSA
ncbi:DUF2283 domain-containing protein [Nodosilinea sp. FACHB-13]|uniref:DUF2283 domain-containing protein n=1 Tax=Cyanophyceae TaxID=3028117 RepID=UPI0032429092